MKTLKLRLLSAASALLALGLLGAGTEASAVTWNVGTYDDGSITTAPPGTDYYFDSYGFSFDTDSLAYKWWWATNTPGDPIDQGAGLANTVSGVTGYTNLSLVDSFEGFDESATGFTTDPGEIVTFHAGDTTFIFLLNELSAFTLSDWTHVASIAGGLSNFRVYNGDCIEGQTCSPGGGGAPSPVPVPGALPLMMSGLVGLGYLARQRRARKA